MTDAERINLVERLQLDVWYGETGTDFLAPRGWVVDLGDPDPSLWRPSVHVGAHTPALVTDGGSSLVVAAPTWREAVDKAVEAMQTMGILT